MAILRSLILSGVCLLCGVLLSCPLICFRDACAAGGGGHGHHFREIGDAKTNAKLYSQADTFVDILEKVAIDHLLSSKVSGDNYSGQIRIENADESVDYVYDAYRWGVKSADCTVPGAANASSASRQHCKIHFHGGRVSIHDSKTVQFLLDHGKAVGSKASGSGTVNSFELTNLAVTCYKFMKTEPMKHSGGEQLNGHGKQSFCKVSLVQNH